MVFKKFCVNTGRKLSTDNAIKFTGLQHFQARNFSCFFRKSLSIFINIHMLLSLTTRILNFDSLLPESFLSNEGEVLVVEWIARL